MTLTISIFLLIVSISLNSVKKKKEHNKRLLQNHNIQFANPLLIPSPYFPLDAPPVRVSSPGF